MEDQTAYNEKDVALMEEDYEVFLQEVEGDKEMRVNMNLYKSKKTNVNANANVHVNVDNDNQQNPTSNASISTDILEDEEDEDDEAIRLEELLDELELNEIDEVLPSMKILSHKEAENATTIDITTSGFDIADVDPKSFSFV